MAQFDQPVKDLVQPATEYTRLAHPIETPTPISAQAKAIEGTTEAIKGGLTAGNKYFEERNKEVSEKAGEEEQSKWGHSVETVWEQVTGKKVDNSVFGPEQPDGGKPDSLIPSTGDVPSPIDPGIKAIENATSAYKQGGAPSHVRDTEYLAQIYKRASQLRAQWPMYRDYIDKGIEKATGITPNANSYIKSMLQDINDIVGKKATGDNHVKNGMATRALEGDQEANAQYQNAVAGKQTWDEALANYSRSNAIEHASKVAGYNFKIMDENSKVLQKAVMDDVRGTLTSRSNSFIDNWMTGVGLTPDVRNRLADGSLTYESLGTNARDVASAVHQQRMLFEKQQNAWLDEPIKVAKGVSTTRRRAGMDQIDPAMKSAMTVFDEFEKGFTDKDFGHIARIANANTDMKNGSVYNTWKGPDGQAAFLRATSVLHAMAGDQAVAGLIGKPGFTDLPSVSSINALIGNALSSDSHKGISGIKETLDTMMRETHGESPQAISGYLRSLGIILNSDQVKDQGKMNLVHHLFDTKEQGWMGLITEDKSTSARHDMFVRFSSPDTVDAVKKLSEKYDHQIMGRYINFMKYTFGQDLFNHDIQDLNTLGSRAGVEFRWETPPGYSPRFVAVPKPGDYPMLGTVMEGQAKRRADEVNANLVKLNKGIAAMHNIFGDSTSALLMQEFHNQGQLLNKPDSIPNALVWSMAPKAAPAGSKKEQERSPGMAMPPAPERKQGLMNTPANTAPPAGGAITQFNQGSFAPSNQQIQQEMFEPQGPSATPSFLERFKGYAEGVGHRYNEMMGIKSVPTVPAGK